MTDPNALTLTVGTGDAAREIAALTREGIGPGLIWLGGFRSDMNGGKAAAVDAYAAETGRAIVRFDYAGHGASGGRFEDCTISTWLEDALAVFDRMATGDQILIGSSMGGWLALLLTRAHRRAVGPDKSRIKGLVLIAPAPDFTERLIWATFPDAVKRRIEETGRYEAPSAYSDDPYVITRALIEDGRSHLLMDAPIETGCPVHILQGVEDADVPWRHAVDLVTCLAGDDVVLTLVKDGDHRLSREHDLRRLIAAIDDMIEAVAPTEG